MSTAKKALYVAVGAGERALEGTRSLRTQIRGLPSRFPSVPSLREIPKVATTMGRESRERAAGTAKRVRATYLELSGRGEQLVNRVSRSQPTKRAVAQTKTARSKVKGAATSVARAAQASGEAVTAAVDKVADVTEASA